MSAGKLTRAIKRRHGAGGFGIEILHPGAATRGGDSGLGALGRIDHAHVTQGTVVRMHPHRDDEILTYVRRGRVRHEDSEGHVEEISPLRLMMMNAGHTFQHQETVIEGPLEGLQIFLRPHAPDLEPQVQFHEFGEVCSAGGWRLIAGPREAPLLVRSGAWVHDLGLAEGAAVPVPPVPEGVDGARLLYLFSGRVQVGDVTLEPGESLILGPGAATVTAATQSDVVLFTTDLVAPVFRGGMFSGNLAHGDPAPRRPGA
jgi:redox-sensitive bicupin YhaK (pirin superfamily)